MPEKPVFNPLDKRTLGESIVKALLETQPLPLSEVTSFRGAGVYAIYYSGDFEPYELLSRVNRNGPTYPIYVGKATPSGSQKGLKVDLSKNSLKLFRRLREHRDSIALVDSLHIEHFTYQCLVVDDVWISLGESLLIQKFEPLWNQIVLGFGNHAPGGGRDKGRKPLWDELHPGRKWAAELAPPFYSQSKILQMIKSYMQEKFPDHNSADS